MRPREANALDYYRYLTAAQRRAVTELLARAGSRARGDLRIAFFTAERLLNAYGFLKLKAKHCRRRR